MFPLSLVQRGNGRRPAHKTEDETVDSAAIRKLLDRHKFAIKLALDTCAHCTLCAESCFLHTMHKDDPSYMPSHKFIHSIGQLYKSKGRVSRNRLQEIAHIVWGKCALCTRCYCPMRIDIPAMIALARDVCRSQGIVPPFDQAEPAAACREQCDEPEPAGLRAAVG